MDSARHLLMKAFYLVFLFLIFACHSKITRTKNPVFNSHIDSLKFNLASLVIFEHLNLSGQEVTADGKTSSELEISVINAHKTPDDENELSALCKAIGSVVKKTLKDQNEYDSYTILFVVQKTKAGVVTRNWKGKEFAARDL